MKTFLNFKIVILLMIAGFCMATIPRAWPQSHLPDVYKSDKIVAIQTQVSENNPLEVGDEIFAFVEVDGQNMVVGKVTYQNKTLPHQLVAFMHETGLTAPDLRSGAYPDEIIYLGFYQKTTGNFYKFAPFKIVYHFDNSEVRNMIAKHLNVYKIWLDDVYQKISPPVATSYQQFLSATKPPILAPEPAVVSNDVITDGLPVPNGAVSDGIIYVKQNGDNLILGNMTKNAMISFEIPRPGTGINYVGGGINSKTQEMTVKIKYLQTRHKNQTLQVKYKYLIDKQKVYSDQKIINVPIK